MSRPNTNDPIERFLEWLKPHQRDLEMYARRMCWEPHEVQDAIHNALLRAVAHFDRCQGPEYFRAWMFKILTREVLALNRKHARIARFEFQVEPQEMENLVESQAVVSENPDDFADWQENLEDHLDLALKSLTESERAVLLLRAIGGFKYQEIAGELDMPVGSVMGYLARARKKMQGALRRKKNGMLEEL